jgi:hypothetical protein
MLWAFSPHGNLSLFLRILYWSANKSKTLLERVLEMSLWRVMGGSAEGMILGEGV